MSSEPNQIEKMKPYLIVAGLLFVVLLTVILWPTSDDAKTGPVPIPIDLGQTTIEADDITNAPEPDVFEAPPKPAEMVISPDMEVTQIEVVEVEVDLVLGLDDALVKSSIAAVASSPALASLLVNERLIERFVINVDNLANAQLTLKDTLLTPPVEQFKTYQQADRTWIDIASFQRYNRYIDALESIDIDQLLALFDSYEDNIKNKYAEISRPGESFDSALIDAINTLLDTPQVPVPIEVYTESAMFKFKDDRLERLSGPQKQLLRTGPENMRRIKDVLHNLRESLEDRNE